MDRTPTPTNLQRVIAQHAEQPHVAAFLDRQIAELRSCALRSMPAPYARSRS